MDAYWLEFEPPSAATHAGVAFVLILIAFFSTFFNAVVILVYRRSPQPPPLSQGGECS